MVFDFVDGAAGSESSLRRARELFATVELEPRALRDVRKVDLSVDLLGCPSALPFFFAPTGATRLMHHVGEPAVASVAAEIGIPYSLSTLGTTTVEELAEAVPDARRWFQLYLMTDRAAGKEMASRAWDAGFDTLLLTIDTPVPGRRNRDVRNGLIVPPRLSWNNLADIASRPRWGLNALTTEPMRMAMVDAESELPAQRMAKVFDPGVTIADVEWLRSEWPGKLVVKGVQSVPDAQLVAGAGVDGVVLSSHGGRQLEHAPLPFELLPAVREVLDPGVQVIVDGGVMSGVDVVACLARGADGVGIGRAYLYGLMAAGAAGVRRVADLLAAEVEATLRLVGCTTVEELRDVSVRLRRSAGC
jgi:L-lactate dehydrogenase (cytochrome)